MTRKKIILSFLGFATTRFEYRELALSLVKALEPWTFEIWAYETDRVQIKEISVLDKESIQYFEGITPLMGALQARQSDLPVVLNPLGAAPIRTFVLPTVTFILPIEKASLWAPLQIFETAQCWESFSNLILSSQVVVYWSESAEKSLSSFVDFQDFVHQMDLLSKDRLIDWPHGSSCLTTDRLTIWLSMARSTQMTSQTSWTQGSPPLVTIVTPSFNHAHFIENTIRSVLSQTYPNFEYLVIDGGSSDKTAEILRSFEGRLTWISEKDRGYAEAVRKGFARARGKYLCWLPSDDEFFDTRSVATLVAAMENSGSDVVYGNCLYVDEDSNWLGQYKTSVFNVLNLKNWCLIPQPSTLIRAATYHQVNGINPDLLSVADYDLWLRIAEAGGKFLRLGSPLSKYRLHSKSITSARTASTYAEIIRLQIKRYGAAFPDWIRGAIGEVIHYIKGKPRVSGIQDFSVKPRGRIRVMLRGHVVEPIVINIPFFQRCLASLLVMLDR
jgi:glycosyltransferase involved in cell wall biosynthesis